MSLLEDIFLQDEAGEAQELERIIDGDEYDERPRSPDSNEDSEKEDEAEEDNRKVDPTSAKPKRVVKNPRVVLNPARLTGPRGIQVILDHFKDFRFKGKGHEKQNLDLVLKKLEHWAYRLYPKFQFEDCLKKIETLGKKRTVMVHLHKIRSDQFLPEEETVVQQDSSNEETEKSDQQEDEFDKLLQQQIDIARATPVRPTMHSVTTPVVSDIRSPTVPVEVSSPSLSEEQMERMVRNRRLAEERRQAKLKQGNDGNNETNSNSINEKETNQGNSKEKNVENTGNVRKKLHKSNVIESSDDDDDSNIASHHNTNKEMEIQEITNFMRNPTVINENNCKDVESLKIPEYDEDVYMTEVDNNIKETMGLMLLRKPSIITDEVIEIDDGNLKQNDNSKISYNNRKFTEESSTHDQKKSNIDKDSSDDECNLTSINEVISVNIHKELETGRDVIDLDVNVNEYTNNKKSRSNIEDLVNTSDSVTKEDKMDQLCYKNKQKNIWDISEISNETESKELDKDNSDNLTNIEPLDQLGIEVEAKETQINKHIEEISDNNVISEGDVGLTNDKEIEVMDVDFSDDF